jgi:ubiquinone/menaquinone biosynthesis C-methylase UbiE
MMLNPIAVAPGPASPETEGPVEYLARLINGHRVSVSICAAARLGLADLLGAGPISVEDLARGTDCQPDMLYRLLRALASIGIFEETDPGTFQNTDASMLLRKDAEPSLHGLASMTGLMHHFVWPETLHSLRTGQPAFNKVFGAGIFDYMKDKPEASDAFNRAMCGYTEVVAQAVVDAYDFSPYRHIIDVGGGIGAFLAKIAGRYAHFQGTVYDLGHVVRRGAEYIGGLGLQGRIAFCAGSFLEAAPAGGDLYTIKIVLCDWQDDDAERILRNIRRAMPAQARLLIVDAVLPPGNTPCFAKFSDINMMLITGGRERTEDDFRRLLSASGFEVTLIDHIHEWVGLVEARPRT